MRLQRLDKLHNEKSATQESSSSAWYACRFVPKLLVTPYWEKPGEISPYDNHGLETDLLTGEMMPGVGQREPVADVTGFLDGVYFWHGRHNP
jgi:hypothetical protein